MEEINTIVSGIEYKVRKIIDLYKKSKTENIQLLKVKEDLIKTNKEQEKIIHELKNKNELIKVSKNLQLTEKDKNAKSKIDEFVREIDKCIALLNK